MSNSDNNEKQPFSIRWQIFCARLKLKWYEFKIWYQNKFSRPEDDAESGGDPDAAKAMRLVEGDGRIANKIREIRFRLQKIREEFPVHLMLFRAKAQLKWYETQSYVREEIPRKAQEARSFFDRPEDSWRFYKIVLAFIVDVIALIHMVIASFCSTVLRGIGKIVGLVPWGIRLAVLAVVAALITAWISQFGVAYVLMKNPSSAEEKVRAFLNQPESDPDIVQVFRERNDNALSINTDADGTDYSFVFYALSEEHEALLKSLQEIFDQEVAAHEKKRQEDIAQFGYVADDVQLKDKDGYKIPLQKNTADRPVYKDPLTDVLIPLARPIAGAGPLVDPATGTVVPNPDKREKILSLIVQFCGISYVYLQDAEMVALNSNPARVIMNVTIHRDGRPELAEELTLWFDEPTDRQKELALKVLSTGGDFNMAMADQLKEMLAAENWSIPDRERPDIKVQDVRRVDCSFVRRTVRLSVLNAAPLEQGMEFAVDHLFDVRNTKYLPYSPSFKNSGKRLLDIRKKIALNRIHRENTAAKTQGLEKFLAIAREDVAAGKRQTEVFKKLLTSISDMEQELIAKEEAAIAEAENQSLFDRTYYAFAGFATAMFDPYSQYSVFNGCSIGSVIEDAVYLQNKSLLEKASIAAIQEERVLLNDAELEIEQWKAAHNRRTVPGDVRDEFIAVSMKKQTDHLPKKLLVRKDFEDKGTEISDWYSAYYKKEKFNQENLRFDVGLLEIIYSENMTSGLESYTATLTVVLTLILLLAAAALVAATFLPVIRKYVYYFALAAGSAFAVYWFCLLMMACDVPDLLMNFVPLNQQPTIDTATRNAIWVDLFWAWCPVAIFSLFLWFPLLCASAREYFMVSKPGKADGCAAFAKNLMCQGESRRFYKSFYWVGFYYFFGLILLPFLIQCCSEYELDEYNIPKGDGGGQMQQQQVQQIKKKKKEKKKRFILNPNSGYMFNVVQIPDEELLEELDEMTETQYETTGGGSFGPGKKGGKPGWPNGMDGGKVRFIRLKYNGGDWDQDMGKGADYNMLLKIKEWAGFDIASETEFATADEIENRFRKKGKKPPFIYITGGNKGGINLSAKEVKQLRDYVLKDGGMIFADNGGGNFDGQFRNMMKRVLPNHSFVDIANDDIIYQAPFHFPNGAPRLFHHSGDRALGIKNNGRWIVFYHQGDINDAWKVGGSGLSAQQQEMAFRLGANVICYAFSAYLAEVFGDKLNE